MSIIWNIMYFYLAVINGVHHIVDRGIIQMGGLDFSSAICQCIVKRGTSVLQIGQTGG